jgi:LytR cell envelope-related transcriptional attenuator
LLTVGRHAESGSDGSDQAHAPVIAGRRRTDVPDALWRGAEAELSDHPTQVGRDRSDRRRDGLLAPGIDPARRPSARPAPGAPAGGVRPREDARQLSRLPLPPVPTASRGVARAAAPAGPLTTAAPFRAVPSPDPRPGILELDALPPGRPSAAGSPRGGSPSRPVASAPPVGRVPRQTTPDGPTSDAYGDWTPAAGTVGRNAALGEPAGNLLVRPAPATTAIPERTVTGRRGRSADLPEDETPDVVRGPGTGPVVGGRAAMRAERQAADMARRKAAAKRNGGSTSALPPEPEEEERRPRRVLKGLVAMAVVGLGVLGVYTYVAPAPQDAAASTPAITTAPTSAPTAELPPLPTEPAPVEPVVTAPVRVPVTVLNATDITGLAGKISAAVVGAGWESPGVGAYVNGDVPVSTVFFTEGDENQRQAALQLIEQFPQLTGPAPRFFELPADVTAPGLVVVAAGEWQP